MSRCAHSRMGLSCDSLTSARSQTVLPLHLGRILKRSASQRQSFFLATSRTIPSVLAQTAIVPAKAVRAYHPLEADAYRFEIPQFCRENWVPGGPQRVSKFPNFETVP